MRRIPYFLITNLAVLIILGKVLKLLGIEPYLNQQGLNYESLLIFAALFGMGGALISLSLSKWTVKRLTGAIVITAPESETEVWLVHTVSNLAREAGIGTSEVAMYHAEDPNAFAMGMRRDNSLVAVSSGLLHRMDKDEVHAVLAHKVTHIANGDMITLSLIQGVVNTFVIFFSRIIGNAVDRVIFKNEEGHGFAFWVTTIITEIFLAVLASVIVFWFSRKREYRDESGAASSVGKRPMDKCSHIFKKIRKRTTSPS